MDQNTEKILANWNDSLGCLYLEAEAESAPILQSLKSIDERYANKSLVGKGGEKEVFKVLDTVTNRQVALAQPIKNTTDAYEHFLREARVLSSLQHPNIIPVYDIGLVDAVPYFTMELISGKCLKDLIGKASQDELLEIFLQVCDAVAYGHSKGILNLDLKPENIIISEFSKVQVIDWGLAQKSQDSIRGKVRGTPGFMAPEQVDEKGQLSEKTDIYLLGGVLYAILNGQPPITGQSIDEILKNTQEGNISSGDQAIVQSLKSVLQKALAVEVENRYDSVALLKSEVSRFRQGFATSAEKAGFIKQLLLLYQRNKVLSHVVLIALVLIIVLTSVFIFNIRKSETAAILSKQEAQELLKLYESEKKLSKSMKIGIREALRNTLRTGQIDTEVDKIIMSSSRRLSKDSNYEVAKTFIFELLKKNPKYVDAWQHLGFIYFVELKFEKAAHALSKSPLPHCQEIARLCLELYAKFGDREPSVDEIAEIFTLPIKRSGGWDWSLMHIVGSYATRHSTSEHAALVHKVLEKINPGSSIVFNYDPETEKLSLKGSKALETFVNIHAEQFNYLTTLALKELDVSGLGEIDGLGQLEKNGVKLIR